MLQQIGLVAVGGAVGAALRYVVGEFLPSDTFPYATLSVNLIGSFFLGILAVGLAQNLLSANVALLIGTGVLGAFTTMSTFSVETIQMLDQGHNTSAMAYVILTMTLSPVLALVGWKLAESMFS